MQRKSITPPMGNTARIEAELAQANYAPLLIYTNLSGETVAVERLDWLEDGYYWEFAEDFDEDGYEHGENLPCARYCIGHEDGDGVSVWLNDDMQEVEA